MARNTLTGQQRLFVDNYMATGSATKAAQEAGYTHPGKQGSRLLKNPHIKKELEKRMSKRSKRTDIDGDWLQAKLVEVFERVTQEVKPALNSKTGKPLTDENGNALFTYNAQAALKALELIGKLTTVSGFAPQKVEMTTQDQVIQRMLRDRKIDQDEDQS